MLTMSSSFYRFQKISGNMSDQLKPSKRPYYRHETNGKGKRQKTAAFTSQNLRISPGITFFCLLCPDFKGGSVIGKGGGIIFQIRQETGAKVRVEETIPGCDERIIIIVGSDKENEVGAEQSKDDDEETNSIDEVDNAEEQDDDGKDNQSFPMEDSQSVKGPSSVQKALLLVFERIAERDSGMDEADEESDKTSKFSLRLLVPSTQVDCLLGNGGGVIKQMSSESGAQISILPRDKLPVCASSSDELFQHSDDRISAAQDAVFCVQTRIVRATPESKEKTVTARILVFTYQIGCLLGKGGSIIAEMRKFTGAFIRILGKDQIPKSALENEEVVQINGEFDEVQEALLQITSRLRDHFFRDAFPSIIHPSNHAFPDQGPPFASYMGGRDFSPPGMYSNLGSSFHKFDAGGLPPHGGFHPHDDRPPFMHNIQ